MLYSELKSKPVILLDGAYLGRVTGAFFVKDTQECAAICCDRGIFSPADVYAVKDAVTLKLGADDLPIPAAETHMFLTESMDVYDCKGEHIGQVSDFSVEPHSKKEEVFSTDKNESFPLRKILFTEQDFAVVNRGDQLPRKKRAAKPKLSTPAMQAPATVLLAPVNPTDEVLTPASVRTVNYNQYGEYRFLIGRTLTKNLTDLNRNILFSAGTVVTNDVIEAAKAKAKLAELTKYSK